jgi:hypothetical protein
MNDFTITSAKYVASVLDTGANASINATINGIEWSVPLTVGNTHYDAIQEWVAAGNTIEAADGLTWDSIRAKRDGILQSTDWTMTTGASVDQAQWAAYRQVIRDIPQTYKDKTPDDVVWPTQPSTTGPNT